MNNREKQAARAERRQQKIDAGSVEARFPGVSGIVISMTYSQAGIRQSLSRTVNFEPGSYAFFEVDCLDKGCVDGGFDFTRIITSMVQSRNAASKGELRCAGGPAEGHSAVVYEVAIRYA